jgi:hypothetical protein
MSLDKTPTELLRECGAFQEKMFFRHFMSTGRVGEIMASQITDEGDRVFYERFCVADIHFVASFRILMEDTMIMRGMNFSYKKIEDFVAVRENENRVRFRERAKEEEVYEEFTRAMVEERLSPGKMTINGDRNSQIRILFRQVDVPSDKQQPRLNEYILIKPLEVLELEQLLDRFESADLTQEEYLREIADWKRIHLEFNMKSDFPDLGTGIPFLKATFSISPRIYEWPIEIDVEREAGLK